MNNFEKLKVPKPKQGQLDRRTARQRPWTMADYAVLKSKPRSSKRGEGGKGTEKTTQKPQAERPPQPGTPRADADASAKTALSSYYTKQDNDFYDLAASELSPSEERLYQRLFRMSWGYQKTTCRVSVLDLAQMVKTDPRQIRRIREGLVDKGWIEILSSRLESITSKKPLEYRVYAAREIIANRGQRGQIDPGQITRGKIAAEMSPESPEPVEAGEGNAPINQPNSKQPLALKKEKESERNIPPLNPPQGGGGGNLTIPPEVLAQAEVLTEKFYSQMDWPQQTERIRQSDIASIVHWHYYEGFSYDVIERAIREIAKKADTRSIKRAEFYLAPLAKSAGTTQSGGDEKQNAAFEKEARDKEARIAKLERIKQKMSKEDFEELYQTQFDDLQAENPSLPLFILETLARQKANQSLLEKFKD